MTMVAFSNDHLGQDQSQLVDEDTKNPLLQHCERQEWSLAMSRVEDFPHEACQAREEDTRMPLHLACAEAADIETVAAICCAYPQAIVEKDFLDMTPLHCACSASVPSAEVVSALLCLGARMHILPNLLRAQDADGDTPLHAACRVGASTTVLRTLVRAYPKALYMQDEDLETPLQRLWSRIQALGGDDVVEQMISKTMMPKVRETWEAVEMLLEALAAAEPDKFDRFNVVQAMIANDCPSDMMKVALAFYPDQALELNLQGQNSLDAAISSCSDNDDVVETLLQHDTTGEVYRASKASNGEIWVSPLHRALYHGKMWTNGVRPLVDADVDAATQPDKLTGLFPFMLAGVFATKGGTSQLTTIFELLRRAPEQVITGQAVCNPLAGMKRFREEESFQQGNYKKPFLGC